MNSDKKTQTTKDKIANTLHDMVCLRLYSQITIDDICKEVPVSRRTFYNYFHDKDEVIEWIVKTQFMNNAFPICKIGMGQKGLKAFFRYIWEDRGFYTAIAGYEGGFLLQNALIRAYDSSLERIYEFARPVANSERRINPDIYKLYTHAAIATVMVYWIKGGMKIPVEEIARDVALMMEHPLSYVRDRYLL